MFLSSVFVLTEAYYTATVASPGEDWVKQAQPTDSLLTWTFTTDTATGAFPASDLMPTEDQRLENQCWRQTQSCLIGELYWEYA